MRKVSILALAVAGGLAWACGAQAQKLQGTGSTGGGDPAAQIRAVPDGGSSPWDDAVRPIIVGTFDSNGSGSVDAVGEVAGIGCSVWSALHEGIQQEYSTGLLGAYGFNVHNDQLQFLGGLIGFTDSVRNDTYNALVECGIAEGPRVASGGGGKTGGGADPSAQIRTVPDGGTDAWDAAVKPILLGAYDQNNSGMIDTAGEISAVSCPTWQALHEGIQDEYSTGLLGAYGFNVTNTQLTFLGALIGISDGVKNNAYDALVGCGITSGGGGSSGNSGGGVDIVDYIRGIPNGGTDAWDTAVKAGILDVYDADNSGAVDTAAELGAISCDVWQAMHQGIQDEYSTGLLGAYGFNITNAQLTFLGDLIGISTSVKGMAYDALQSCGIN